MNIQPTFVIIIPTKYLYCSSL